MKQFLSKLTSRKLWLALAGVVVGIAITLGVDTTTIETIAGAVTAMASAITYIVVEGRIDANKIKDAIEQTQDAVDTIKKEGE